MNPDLSLFLPGVTYGSGGFYASAMVVADVNGDGRPDIIVANCAPSGSSNCFQRHGVIGVLLGNGDGTFQPPLTHNSGGFMATSLAVADVNGDGKPDLLVGHFDGHLGVLRGKGDGTFRTAATFDTGGMYTAAVAVADVNRDGKPDVVVANSGCANIYSCLGVLLGKGDGTFALTANYDAGGVGINWLTIADANVDGTLDLLVAYGCLVAAGCNAGSVDGGVGILFGIGDGSFIPAVTYDSGGRLAYMFDFADVNGDGTLDLVVANSFSDTLGVLLGNGDGTFQAARTFGSGGSYPRSVTVADVNRDGKPDLLVPYYLGDSSYKYLGVLLGNGDGTFQTAVSYDSGNYATNTVVVVDVNGDGLPDLLVSGAGGNSNSDVGSVGVLLHAPGPSPTTTTVASSPNPSVFGQSVTLTASVNSSSGTPSGTVAFLDRSNALGNATLANGTASISISSLAAGSHSMTAAYQGTDDFGASTSASLNQVVYPATTTTSLTSSRNPAVVHQLVTYAATVASQYGGAVTGTVTFQDSGSTIATVSLSGNQATYTTSYKATGSHLITTAYLGDTDNTASTSHGLTQTISSFSSKTVVTTSGSPAFVGQPITFTATVTSPGGTIPDGELVTFSDGTATLASVPLSGGTAAYTISSLSAKAHVINAAYPGDAAFGLSAATVQQLVQRYPTTTTLVSNLNPSVFGQAVTLTATVTSAGPDMPTGNVVFKDGTLALGTVALSGGIATLTTLARSFAARTLDAGTHSITAEYEGNSASAKSGSPVVNQIVSQASTTTTITSTRNPWPKGMLYFVATVRSSTGASVGGKVTFTAGNATRTELIHSRGKAVTFTLFLPPGSYTVTATYSGGTNFTGSSASMTQVVQ